MPIYEYKCQKCGHRFEVLQRIGGDGSTLKCPSCDAPKPEKMISAFASNAAGSLGAPVSSGRGGCSSGFG